MIRGALDSNTKNFYVTYVVNGVEQYDLFSGSTTINLNSDYTWELKAQGNVITLLKDGAVLGSATDSSITAAGQPGLELRRTEVQLDWWKTTWGTSASTAPFVTAYSTPAASGFTAVGPGFGSGRVGQALAFNGTSDVFVFPNSADLFPSQFTLMAVVKATQTPTGSYATVLAKSTSSMLGGITSGSRLLIDTSGRARFEVGRPNLLIAV